MPASHPLMVMMALDVRILYSDQALLAADKNGVVINFMQEGINLHGKAQKMPVARIGMSYEQAQEFLRVLHNTLAKADDLRPPEAFPPLDHSPSQIQNNQIRVDVIEYFEPVLR